MSSYSACIVIPNYNHCRGFRGIVETLLSFNLPIIIVNDGSNTETTTLLESVNKDYALVSLRSLSENQGKGGAVIEGMLFAFNAGYTHALQIDADGQHDLQDISRFFEASQSEMKTIICGRPVYDESVPLGRLLPRYITHFWVWVETLSFEIKDSMCGFRVYPLASLIDVLRNESVGKRMDFDTEVLVRLYWRNATFNFLPTKVIYPEDGESRFRLLYDNWLITKMHTRLFFGMLYRFPRLLRNKWRKRIASAKKSEHWGVRKEKGSFTGIKILIWIYKVLGRKVFSILLHPVIAYFVLTSRSARESSREYLQQIARHQKSVKSVNLLRIYQHFYQFGSSAIDKIACWLGDIKRSDVKVHGEQFIQQVADSGKGAVFLGSHLGNLELCRALGLKSEKIKINAVVFNKHAPKFQKSLSESSANVNLNLIHVESIGIDTAILLKDKVEQGEVVIIVGDRTSLSSVGRVHYVDFLGKKAPFAEGPHILAGLLECPVYLLFCIKQNDVYNVYLEHFADSLKFKRNTRNKELADVVQKFAHRLSYYCQKAPLQWFNFYDFWCADSADKIQRKD